MTLIPQLSTELEALLQQTRDWGPGVYKRLYDVCTEHRKLRDGGVYEPDPITTVARLRDLLENEPWELRRHPNFGNKSFGHLKRLLNGDENKQAIRAQEPSPITLDADGECPWCHVKHGGRCPHIKSLEYFETGAVRRVEFFEGEP